MADTFASWGAMTDTTLSTVDAAKAAGVSVQQLNHWARQGYVAAQFENGNRGRGGKSRRWTPGEVDVAEQLGVFSRQLVHRENGDGEELLGLLSMAVRDGTALALTDGDYEVRVLLRARSAK